LHDRGTKVKILKEDEENIHTPENQSNSKKNNFKSNKENITNKKNNNNKEEIFFNFILVNTFEFIYLFEKRTV